MYNLEEAYRIINDALESFFNEEYENILFTVSERNLIGQLSYRIKDIISSEYGNNGYQVDIEYNRKQNGEIKTIINKEYKNIPITCDLIVHTRGKKFAEDNFIAVEMKKSDRTDEEKNKDRYRLIALTKPKNSQEVWSSNGLVHPENVCGYLLGIYIELNLKNENVILEFYEQGRMVKNLKLSLEPPLELSLQTK